MKRVFATIIVLTLSCAFAPGPSFAEGLNLETALSKSLENLSAHDNYSIEMVAKFKVRIQDEKGEFQSRTYDLACKGNFTNPDLRFLSVEGLTPRKVLLLYQSGFNSIEKFDDEEVWRPRDETLLPTVFFKVIEPAAIIRDVQDDKEKKLATGGSEYLSDNTLSRVVKAKLSRNVLTALLSMLGANTSAVEWSDSHCMAFFWIGSDDLILRKIALDVHAATRRDEPEGAASEKRPGDVPGMFGVTDEEGAKKLASQKTKFEYFSLYCEMEFSNFGKSPITSIPSEVREALGLPDEPPPGPASDSQEQSPSQPERDGEPTHE